MASVTVSTTPTTPRASEAEAPVAPGVPEKGAPRRMGAPTGSLARRMMLIAAGWIFALLLLGGIALDRALAGLVERQFDEQLELSLTALIASSEIDPMGDVMLNRGLGDQRFLEPNSGFYWQISAEGREDFTSYSLVAENSRSLWDSKLNVRNDLVSEKAIFYDIQKPPSETVRIAQRTLQLPGSDSSWQFVVGGSREDLEAQIANIRAILVWSFAILGIGLLLMAMAQTWYGLGPLRRVRKAIARIRSNGTNRVTDPLPAEVQPMVDELNALLEHTERQAEEARTHAGNLAHALKTPLTVVTNAASAGDPELGGIVQREAALMRRQVDHHLARARAAGRRGIGLSRANVMESARGVERAVVRLYPDVRFDIAGKADAEIAVERQDLDEMLGNLIENAAKYGGGSVFITVDAQPDADCCAIWVEDDGAGIPEEQRTAIFARGARLDTEKPGTGLGLAIVRDVAEIYGGWVTLRESEDLGGLLAELHLPRAG